MSMAMKKVPQMHAPTDVRKVGLSDEVDIDNADEVCHREKVVSVKGSERGLTMSLQFIEPSVASEFVLFQKTDINLLIVVVMVAVHFTYYMVYITYWQPVNSAFIAALAVGVVMILAAFISAGARFAAFFPTP